MRLLDGTVRSRSLGGFLDLVLRVLTSVVLFFGGQNATSSAGFFPSLVWIFPRKCETETFVSHEDDRAHTVLINRVLFVWAFTSTVGTR